MDVLFGSVSDDWESMSESSEELEVIYGGQAISLLSNLDETIGKIDDFLSFERAFFHGDVVCLASQPSGQMGRITALDMLLDLEATNGKVIKDVHSDQILKIRSLSIGDYVVQGCWLGRVDKVIDLVTVVFSDGTKCNVLASDQEDLVPMNSSNILDNDDDPQYPFYPGQRVHAKVPQARWLCGSSHKQGTICAVKPGMVYIHWMASVINGYRVASPSKLQDAKDVTLLPMHSNWQPGDLCLLPVNNIEEVFVVTKIRTKVDVIWQDGTQSLGLDSKKLLPINIMDAHEFWAHQFVVEKGGHENVEPKWGCVKAVDAKEKTVKVKWENDSGGEETIVSAYELLDHPDYSFCIGDVVFRLIVDDGYQTENGELRVASEGDDFYLSCIGNVVGFKDGVVEVKWAAGLTTMVTPNEIFRFDKYEASAPSPPDTDENVEQITQQIVDIQDSEFSKEKGKKLQGLLHYFDSNRGFISRMLPRWSGIVFITDFAANLFRYSASTSNESSVYDDNNGKKSQDLNENNVCEDSAVKMQESDLLQKTDKVDEIDSAGEPSSLNRNDGQRFKQFDMVTDCSDHFFIDRAGKEITSLQVNKSWLKKVGQEWSILQKNLPEAIFVRAYEERMDLFRAAIIGASGTPYHDGIFFFDIFLPPQYPNEPPRVHYHSGGLRLNPNLYESGKVCLSLLNTWTGGESEVWNPESSTVLQVLVSLQGLVLNEKPYFNEAGYDTHMGKSQGEKNSVSYNENAFLLTCQTMIYLLRNPPKNFEEMVVEHFRGRCSNILGACKEYINGAPVGFASSNIIMKHEIDKGSGSSSSSTGFKIMVSKLFDKLIEAFTHEGIDCGEFVKP